MGLAELSEKIGWESESVTEAFRSVTGSGSSGYVFLTVTICVCSLSHSELIIIIYYHNKYIEQTLHQRHIIFPFC